MKHILTTAALLALAAPAGAHTWIQQSHALQARFASKPVLAGHHVKCWPVYPKSADGVVHPATACAIVEDRP